MIVIPLNQGYVALVDDADSDLSNFSWYVNKGQNRPVVYATRVVPPKRNKSESMHRVILQRILGRSLKPEELTDHINSDGLDNRRSNLRLASSSQNHYNRRKLGLLKGSPTSSQYKGVRWESDRQKWRVDIRINGKKKYLGRFVSEIDAALAYNSAAMAAFGEYARLNDTG